MRIAFSKSILKTIACWLSGFFVWFGLLAGCAGFKISLNGATIPPEAKSISVAMFLDDAGTGPPNLAITTTEKMRSYFQRNTRLDVIAGNGDLQYEGSVTGYTVTPVAPTGEDTQQAGLQRLTITLQVQYLNTFDEEAGFDESFSFFADFPPDKNITDVERDLIEVILNQIMFDVFNRSLANW
ncbi:MAG: hypothetical protein EAZ57_01880 [Cytophagales bacterium]|nr:MAG: hypothetical protein EAZ67_02710 [Cytophagales bacterium]TAF61873.1 MAG: hypothetical protein EAZ57_01880 [Cytophagales bacterium]